MTAVLEHGNIVRVSSAQVAAKLLNDVRPRGVTVLQDFDVQRSAVKIVGQIVVEMIDIIQAAGQLPDARGIVVDANQ